MRSIRVFLSSPGDCAAERKAVHALAATLNADPIVHTFCRIEVIAWDWGYGIPMEAHQSPQTSVNERLPVPEACDIYVGIFRNRFGTPLSQHDDLYRKADGSAFGSGSEYEFHRAWDARRRGHSLPHLLVYRLNPADPDTDPVQRSRLESFFAGAPFSEDAGKGYVQSFTDTGHFSNQLNEQLRQLISQWHPHARLPLQQWLEQQAQRFTLDAGPRYTREAHVEGGISQVFDWLLARPTAIRQFDESLAKVWEYLSYEAALQANQQYLEDVARQLRAHPHWESLPDFSGIKQHLQQLASSAWQLRDELESQQVEQKATNPESYRLHKLQQLASACHATCELIEQFSSYAQQRVLLLTGPAGQGKTHSLAHELNHTLAEGGIAVGVLGHTLSATGDLWGAILQRLECTQTQSAWLDELENAAAQQQQRALIIIDALNETHDRGRWKGQLRSLLSDILSRPHLAVALSVRSDYRNLVLPTCEEAAPWAEYQHTGFTEVAADAVATYCAHYGVQAPVAPPIGELSNPLYVQLLVKSLKGRDTPVHWLPSWLEVWRDWLQRLEEDTDGKLQLNEPRPDPIRRTLNKLADAMIESGTFELPRHEAERIARKTTGADGVIAYLCSAGALMDQLNEDDDELVIFGYERLCDTFIIDRLLTRRFQSLPDRQACRQSLEAALAAGGELYPLANPEYMQHPLNYNRAGLLKALCLMAPQHIGAEIPDLLQFHLQDSTSYPRQDWDLQEAFLDSLRWRQRNHEFAASNSQLMKWFNKLHWDSDSEYLDERARLALIPGHPFSIEQRLHPRLCQMSSPGERDAAWTIHLVPLWFEENSNLKILMRWAEQSSLDGLHPSVAMAAARLLAWVTATSQRGQRESAIGGLTRILATCPSVLPEFLPDFLAVNDAYVLEAVLIAVLGVVMQGKDATACSKAAALVYDTQFADGNARWCHLTIRHYARCIVEKAQAAGWLPDADRALIRPPYRSRLPLEQLPNEEELRNVDPSAGYRSMAGSCFGHDFNWYVMGGTSGQKHFSTEPLFGAASKGTAILNRKSQSRRNMPVFSTELCARFVVWNCPQLGWTAERFDAFDTGHWTYEHRRTMDESRTERIGKKYQWIGWQTMLAFLTDNYRMLPEWDGTPVVYDRPQQISYIDVLDPSRWLYAPISPAQPADSHDSLWKLGSMRWPLFTEAGIQHWARSPDFDLPPADLIHHTPTLPASWGKGPWLQLATEHSWIHDHAPGQWGIGQAHRADIWWQIVPFLIRTESLPDLLQQLKDSEVIEHLHRIGRISTGNNSDINLLDWPALLGDFNAGFSREHDCYYDARIPVPWMPMVATTGDPDRREHLGAMQLPWPRLFREWDLTLDLEKGCVMHAGDVLFGLGSIGIGENILFARLQPLQKLLAASGYSLIWLMRGERRAFLNWGNFDNKADNAWIKLRALGTLGADSRTQILWYDREDVWAR